MNIALPAEFEHARRWLEALGAPAEVSLVPGNHDAYVAGADMLGARHWAPYMAGDAATLGAADSHDRDRPPLQPSLHGARARKPSRSCASGGRWR